MSAQQDVAIVEDGLASGAGRAEAGVAAFLSVCVQILYLSGPTYHFPVYLSNTVSMLVYTIALFFLKWVDECKEKVYYTI